jgi:phosphoglycolate phosphatase-like HAD superfamily hydrolase
VRRLRRTSIFVSPPARVHDAVGPHPYDGVVAFPHGRNTVLRRGLSVDAVGDDGIRSTDWMRQLAAHFTRARSDHPADDLCVVFDVDGTILDMRYLVAHVLLAYDRARGTAHFHGLRAADITVSENRVDLLLDELGLPEEVRLDALAFYRERLWSSESILAASLPYEGVLSVIRWFQIQPGTHVALNTGRSERLRVQTLESLNALASAFRVRFDPDLLCMRPGDQAVPTAKVASLARLREMGLRVVAVVDNEPENLRAMAAADAAGDVLFLHADTIFESQREPAGRSVAGTTYGLSGLVSEEELRERVHLVWHGVNDEENLREFLASGIRWAEVDVRTDPLDRLILRHDSFDELPWDRAERPLEFERCLDALRAEGRFVKADLKTNGPTLARTLEMLERARVPDRELWFNGEIQVLGPRGFREIRSRHPDATISCPVDFTVPMLLAAPELAEDVLHALAAWGVSRLSLRWSADARRVLDLLESMGWEVNIYGVPNLEAFLEAALLLPASVTADFNFPEWRYFGRGSGQGGVSHRYELEPVG